jgi:hypothetical protein
MVYFVAVFAGILVLIIVMSTLFSREAQIRRHLRKMPPVRIADFPTAGGARVTGNVIGTTAPLVAPLSGRPCVAWRVEVDQYRSNGKSGSWRRLIRQEKTTPFTLDDGSGKALVLLEADARMALNKDGRYRSGTFNDATPELEAFLSSHGLSSQDFFGFNKKLRYREGVVEEGEQVVISGHFNGSGNQDVNLVIGSGYGEPLHLTDMVHRIV